MPLALLVDLEPAFAVLAGSGRSPYQRLDQRSTSKTCRGLDTYIRIYMYASICTCNMYASVVMYLKKIYIYIYRYVRTVCDDDYILVPKFS